MMSHTQNLTPPLIVSFCSSQGLNPSKALEIFEEMKREGVRPTVVTFSALISACEKVNNEYSLFFRTREPFLLDAVFFCLMCSAPPTPPHPTIFIFRSYAGPAVETRPRGTGGAQDDLRSQRHSVLRRYLGPVEGKTATMLRRFVA